MNGDSEVKTIPQKTRVFYDTYAALPVTGVKKEDLAYATDLRVLMRWNGAAWETITVYSLAGLLADIPVAATLPNGSIYFATDTLIFYMKQGAAWLSVSGTEIAKVYKSADETVNNSIALQNDDELFLPIAANEKCEIIILCYTYSSGVADIKFAVTVPAGASLKVSYADVYLDATAAPAGNIVIIVSGTTLGGHGSGTVNSKIAKIYVFVSNGVNAGNVQLQWAQNTAEVSNTKVEIGSYMEKIIVP